MSISIYDLASKNLSLLFVDDESGDEYRLKDLATINFQNGSKKLGFLYLDNSVVSIRVYWSLMKSNHSAALISQNLSDQMKIQLENIYQPSFIFDPTRNLISGYRHHHEQVVDIFFNEGEVQQTIHPDIKLLLSTSGTTGSPKFVKLSESNLTHNAQSIVDYLPINGSDVTPLNLPIYYSYGLSILNSHAINGGKIICGNNDVLKNDFWAKCQKLGFTSIAGVPYTYEMLDRIGFGKKNYPSIKYMTQAGGKLSERLLSKFIGYTETSGIYFFVMYGQTEATARMSYVPHDLIQSKIGSIGIPIKDGQFTLDETTGELCYSGPNVYGGYVTDPKDLSVFDSSKLLRTGDIARVDSDGYYYIVGRIKRFVKLFGNRINLDEVEELVSKNLKISVKCAGLNDEKLIAFLPPHSDPKRVLEFISKELKIHITGIKCIEVSRWPQTLNGKVDYNKLIEEYGN